MKRKYMLLQAHEDFLVEMFKNGRHEAYEVVEGLPIDAEIVNMNYDEKTGILQLRIYSKKFKALENGAEIPVIWPKFVKYAKITNAD